MTYMNFSLKMYVLMRLNGLILQFWVLKRNAAIVGNYIEKANIYTVPADSSILRKIFLFTVQTTGCSKIQTIEELAKYQEIYPEFNSICSNQALVSDLIVRMLCPAVPLAQNWKPGVKARTLKKKLKSSMNYSYKQDMFHIKYDVHHVKYRWLNRVGFWRTTFRWQHSMHFLSTHQTDRLECFLDVLIPP